MKKTIHLSAITLILAALPIQAIAGHPDVSSLNAGTEAAELAAPHTGKVVETLNSGGYTYVCLEKGGKKTWVAVPEMSGVKVGSEMSFTPGSEMVNFKSKTLGRTFDSIYFSSGPMATAGNVEGKKSKGSASGLTSPAEKIKVEKATGPNAHTIAELYQQKAKLDGKNVLVRGKVTKVAAGIMGKNWIHLQDGSGDSKKGTHDLTVTSQSLPATGDVVTVSGKLAKDKDFGGGYKYEVIIEDGAIKP